MSETIWEQIATGGSGDGALVRLKVPGGWLYRDTTVIANRDGLFPVVTMCFVPEPSGRNVLYVCRCGGDVTFMTVYGLKHCMNCAGVVYE